jgi:hypothetical protein
LEYHWSTIERPTGPGVPVYIILITRVELGYLVDWELIRVGKGWRDHKGLKNLTWMGVREEGSILYRGFISL